MTKEAQELNVEGIDESWLDIPTLRRELDVMVDTITVANNRARLVEAKLEIALAALREIRTLNAVCKHDRGDPSVRALREIEALANEGDEPGMWTR